jgi:GNAT superfamily N-acetyltransferase
MNIISVRKQPQYAEQIITYLQKCWNGVSPIIYRDCISHCIDASKPLPQWYVLEKEGEFLGCAGLITNDFISRMDLYPWLCALFIEKSQRGNGYGQILIEKAKEEAKKYGFSNLYLCTNHIGYYEKYGFKYIGDGYHPWGEQSRIYEIII